MKSTKASAIASTLSPHAEPFILPRPSLSAEVNSSVFFFPDSTCYSSPVQPQVANGIFGDCYDVGQYNGSVTYYISDDWVDLTPASTSPSLSYASPNAKPILSPSLTLKKLETECDSTCELSSDEIRSVDSPCYKGRNWSQVTPLHIGETSAPPRVTVEKLREVPKMSFAVNPVGHMIDSDGKSNVPVPVGPWDSGPDVGSSGDISIKQNLDPGTEKGSTREKLLQKVVCQSDMLLQIPSNAAELAEGDDMKIKIISEGLEKLLERSKKRSLEDNEGNLEAIVYKSLWINAEMEKLELEYKLQRARMMVDTAKNKSQKKTQKI